jgi:hypothetical protein
VLGGRFDYRGAAAERELVRDRELGATLLTVATAAADAARSFAPARTGHYRDSLHAELDLTMEGYAAFVVSDDFKAVWIEFGTGEPKPTPAFQPMRRGAESAGLRLGVGPL